jgi:parvulin-like peptidyl-prolyl isomerase
VTRSAIFRPFGALLLMSLIASCGGSPSGSQPTASGNNPPLQATILVATPVLPLNAQGQPLVAKVNNIEITLDQFQQALVLYQSQQPTAADETALKQTVLDNLINQVLIEQAAATQGVTVTDVELNTEVQSYIDTAQSQGGWQQWLTENHFASEDQFRATLRDTLLTGRMVAQVTQNVTGNVPQVHARHILVDTEAQANDVMNQLRSGADFAAMATQYSKDVTTNQQGGDLGWFTQDTLTEPILTQTAFSLNPGEIAGPIPTTIGFDILQTLEKAARPLSPENQAAMAKSEMDAWLQTLAQQATIERYL